MSVERSAFLIAVNLDDRTVMSKISSRIGWHSRSRSIHFPDSFINVFKLPRCVNTNFTLGSGSTTLMELSKTGSTLANDAVTVSGTLTYGGTLMVAKVGAGVLAANDTFKLFNGSAFASSFSSLILPALTGNLVWYNHLLSISRTIAVAIGVNTTSTNIVAVGTEQTQNRATYIRLNCGFDSFNATIMVLNSGGSPKNISCIRA